MRQARFFTVFLPPNRWLRHMLFFALLCALIALPFVGVPLSRWASSVRQRVAVQAQESVRALTAWTEHLKAGDFISAQNDLRASVDALRKATDILRDSGGVLTAMADRLPFENSITRGKDALSLAEQCIRLADILTQLFSRITENGSLSVTRALADLPAITRLAGEAHATLQSVAQKMSSIPLADIPYPYRSDFTRGKDALDDLLPVIRSAENLSSLLTYVLGSDAKRRFLVVFQNDAELRATGGFAGSFAIADIDRGAITHLEFPGGGSYDLQGSLRARLRAPQALAAINPRWEFQDANWFSDFPTSAKKLASFYEKSGGSSVDGVFAINARVFEQMLSVIGPIALKDYGVTATAENFFDETISQVENKYDKSKNKPKKFLGDLLLATLERLPTLNSGQTRSLTGVVITSTRARDLQFFSFQADQEQRSSALGLSGEVRTAPNDFLQIIDSNVGGNKSDRVLTVRVAQSIRIFERKPTEVTLRIERIHSGVPGKGVTGLSNRSFLRFLVPLGSELLASKGFLPVNKHASDTSLAPDPDLALSEGILISTGAHPIMQGTESGKTVFGGSIDTPAGTSSTAELHYRLPASLRSSDPNRYSLLVQRQSGSTIREYAVRIIAPEGHSIQWSYPSAGRSQKSTFVSRGTLDSDMTFAIHYSKKK